MKITRERDDLLRDMSDMGRGNRLLIQENDSLNEKYNNLLELYNRLALMDPSKLSKGS